MWLLLTNFIVAAITSFAVFALSNDIHLSGFSFGVTMLLLVFLERKQASAAVILTLLIAVVSLARNTFELLFPLILP